MRPGDVVRWAFIQGDGQRKMRPALVLAIVPPFNDWLVCAISTRLDRHVDGLDMVIDVEHPDHARSGLRVKSLVRVAHLATLPDNIIQGSIGSISAGTLTMLKGNLQKWLSGS